MADRNDEYRKQAADAQAWANRSTNPYDKASWLRIAQAWMGLIRQRKPTEQDAFDERVKARGTGQHDSESSH